MADTSKYTSETLTQPLVAREEGQNWQKGVKQTPAFRDGIFAILYFIHISVIISLIFINGKDTLHEVFSGNNDYDVTGYLYATSAILLFSVALNSILIITMISFASVLVKFSLLFSVTVSATIALYMLMIGNVTGFIFGFLFFAISVCYTRLIWKRVPFATANLVTSLTAIKENFGITFVPYLFMLKAFLWYIIWFFSFYVTYEKTKVCDDETGQCTFNAFYVFLFLVSLFWTQQVLSNTVHTTVAGVVGTWWFAPQDASSCCSSGLTGSLCRSTTYSFGSICLGSLIVAIVEALRQIAKQARLNDRDNASAILLCILDCLLSIVESIAKFVNKWAFVYVGIYGYEYIEAGKNVMTLFGARGWDIIINQDLIGNVMSLVTIMTGCIFGSFGLLLENSTTWFADAGEASQTIAFLLCFIVGILLCNIILSIIASGVNATIVLFAEAPDDFQINHPELSTKMSAAYAHAFPSLF